MTEDNCERLFKDYLSQEAVGLRAIRSGAWLHVYKHGHVNHRVEVLNKDANIVVRLNFVTKKESFKLVLYNFRRETCPTSGTYGAVMLTKLFFELW